MAILSTFFGRLSFNKGGGSYYPLTKQDMRCLQSKSERVAMPARAGDVLLMAGGTLVHESPAVEKGCRVTTYADFRLPR